MQFKTILLGTAALALMAGSAAAQDAPKKHHHRHTAAASGSVDARIDELEAEIHELKRQQHAQAETQAAVAPPADQQVTQAQFEALQNQVYEQQAADASLTKSSWWSNTKISGRMYYDITNLDNSSTDALGVKTKSSQTGTNFDIKRFYLGVDHQFNDIFSANLTTDFTYDGGASTSQIYIKKAYLQAKLSDAFTVRLGSADLPWVPFVEDLYGYRYVENVMIDRDKYGTSADWGAHILGTFGDGLFSYQVSAVNGQGYKKIPTGTANRSQGIDLEGRLSMNYDGFVAGVGGYTGKLGKDVEGLHTNHTANRFDAIAGYFDNGIRIGVEYFKANDWNSVTSAVSKDNADGYSVFGSYQFDPQWGVFGRYEHVSPKTDSTIGLGQLSKPRDTYYNFGVSYSPTKIVDFALVYKHDRVGDGTLATSNGTIGGADKGTYNEIGLWGQLRW
jgi:hypothetical protein